MVSTASNDRPVIGIMAQPTDSSLSAYGDQYLVASYVKWVEASGARVVPVLYNQSTRVLSDVFKQLNGLVFPGGHCGFHGTAYGNASWFLMQLAMEANDAGDIFPIWGTCQGFQQLVQFGSGQMEPSILHRTPGTEGLIVPLNFTGFGLNSSRLIGEAPFSVKESLKSLSITINLHHYSVMTDTVERSGSKLNDFFSVVASNYDSSRGKIVSHVEARKYPF
jgi:gamma-glutamyl hydrolase